MWQGIYGHDDVAERFRRTLARGRLASTYLFVGPPGIGKRRFALELARALLCTRNDDAELEACGQCESCRLFAAGNHPDLEVLGLPPDKATLPIALFIGDKEHRNQQGLCHRISLRPFLSHRRIAIIDDADHFSLESANCLLKTLEEPPAHSLLILIGTSPSRQLPTIRSRAQVVRFMPLASAELAQVLLENSLTTDSEQAARMAKFGEGSVQRAVAQADPALWEFRQQLFRDLAAVRPDSARMARAVQAFMDEAGDEPAQKRDRLRAIVSFAIDFYRLQLQCLGAAGAEGDPLYRSPITGEHARSHLDPDIAVRAIDRCLDTLEQVDRNANLGLVVQAWCEDITDLTMVPGA